MATNATDASATATAANASHVNGLWIWNASTGDPVRHDAWYESNDDGEQHDEHAANVQSHDAARNGILDAISAAHAPDDDGNGSVDDGGPSTGPGICQAGIPIRCSATGHGSRWRRMGAGEQHGRVLWITNTSTDYAGYGGRERLWRFNARDHAAFRHESRTGHGHGIWRKRLGRVGIRRDVWTGAVSAAAKYEWRRWIGIPHERFG